MTGKEVIKNMEYLIKLLHREWERSGRTKAEASICFADVGEVKKMLAEAIQARQMQLAGEMTFKQGMELSKENFILLRLVRKIKKSEERAERKKEGVSFVIELDKEEYKLFSMLINIEGE